MNEPYQGRIVGKELDNNMKLYYCADNTYSLVPAGMAKRKVILRQFGITNSLGFATVWQPDALIGRVREKGDGFYYSIFNFGDKTETQGVKNTCITDGSIIGKETHFLEVCESQEDYKNRWVLQENFYQKYGIRL